MNAHKSRAEIMRIAEPEDSFINLCIEIFGVDATADFLTLRQPLTQSRWLEELENHPEVALAEPEKYAAFTALTERIERWKSRASIVSNEQECRMAASLNAWLCVPEDDDWPTALDDLGSGKPYGLWGRGERLRLQELNQGMAIAVVGSRDVTAYGNSATAHLVGELAGSGATIISGGALGIDASAHRTALHSSTAELNTVALMACGVDRLYPKHNELLLQEIARTGLILSEVPLGFSPTRWRFLQRNRLIAALSQMTIVVEARWRSGALNTAHHALELGRELRAVPGSIFSPSSEGCHKLLKDGLATVATDGQDLLKDLSNKLAPEQEEIHLSFEDHHQQVLNTLDEVQRRVWDALPIRKPASIESLSSISGVPVRATMMALSQLATVNLALNKDHGWIKQR